MAKVIKRNISEKEISEIIENQLEIDRKRENDTKQDNLSALQKAKKGSEIFLKHNEEWIVSNSMSTTTSKMCDEKSLKEFKECIAKKRQ